MKIYGYSIRKNKSKGFTLTEILVVVMVVAVLAAVAYPLYTKAATKSRAIEAINLLEMVRNKQLSKYARDKVYYTTAGGLGQLTSNASQETLTGQVLQIKDYTISLNNVKNCATATYDKGATNFTFSSGYETAGLGCTGSICTSFGNILGTAQDVCNCGSKTCSGGYTLNDATCNCDCNLGCEAGGSCFAPYGGGSSRPCASGCGTETSSSSCTGAVWSGSCWTATQTQPTTQSCGNSGTQTRTCTPTCTGGTCGGWGACTGQTCPSSTKPATSQACGNCGTQTRTVTCDTNTGNWTTGSWGTCGGQGVCAVGATQTCNGTGTQTCSSSCAWGNCSVINCDNATKPAATQSCGNCNTGTQTRTVTCNTSTGTWTSGTWGTCTGGGTCAPGATQTCNGTGTQTCSSSCAWSPCSACDNATKPATTQACGNCGTQTRTVTCTSGAWTTGTWGTCTGTGVCAPGATQTCNSTGTQTCSSSCAWGSCSVNNCDQATKPATSQACGNCNTGTQTRTVTCNTSTGTWTSGTWGTCTGGGTCSPGATQTCNTTGTQTCSSSCAWGSCSVINCDNGTKPATSQSCGNCNTGTQTRTVTCDTSSGTWTTGAWGTCAGATGCTPGANNTGGCPSGQTGYITQTCNSSCQWYVSVNTCQSACTPSTVVLENPTYRYFSESASADSCDGTPAYQFSCNGPKTCVDTIKMGGCTDSGGTSYTPDWTGGPYKYQKGSGYLTTSSYGSIPSSTCQYSANQMVIGSSGPYDDAFARSVCMQQCYAIGLPYGYGCSTSCQVIGNCSPQSNNAGYNCQVYSLSCTAVELKCQTMKYSKVCC